jgi:phage gpG-like protein
MDFKNEIGKLEEALQKFPKIVATLASDLFDQNFEQQSFFGEEWKVSEYVKKTRTGGSLLQKTGRLRRSIKYVIIGNVIIFTSNAPYAEIHNEGGIIQHPGGTAYYYNKKRGESIWVSNRKAQGKNYPRTKPHKIEIPQRQFIGDHVILQREIEKAFDELLSSLGF